VARFTVTLARSMSAPTSVSFGTMNGSAIGGEDYSASNGTLTFEPGETSKILDVTILNDARFEDDEVFTLRLSNGLEATATIVNDDAKARSRSVRH
jgi:serralysin